MTSFKIVVIGYSDMFSQLLLGISETEHRIVGAFRHERVLVPAFWLKIKDFFAPSKEYLLMKNLQIKDIKAKSVNSKKFKNEIKKLEPDIIIVGSWSEKFKKEIIDLPKIATINVHPSLLPKYRGANPYARVIENQETKSGLTFHLMDEEFDKGPILCQLAIPIRDNETGHSLKNKTTFIAKSAVKELLQDMATSTIIPIKQDEAQANYQKSISEEDILIDINAESDKISAKLRGIGSWTSCYIPYKNIYFKVRAFKVKNNDINQPQGLFVQNNNLCLSTVDNKIIVFKKVQVYGIFKKFFTKLYLKFFFN